jgi:hypothetical protein
MPSLDKHQGTIKVLGTICFLFLRLLLLIAVVGILISSIYQAFP